MRTYKKKSITEAEVMVRLLPELRRAKRRLASYKDAEEYARLSFMAGYVSGLEDCRDMSRCYFSELDSQIETDRCVRRMVIEGYEVNEDDEC